jgi:hypothetical protein
LVSELLYWLRVWREWKAIDSLHSEFPVRWPGNTGGTEVTKSEVNRFRAILTDRVAELEHLTRQRDGIAVDRTADLIEEIQAASECALAVSNLDREYCQLRQLATSRSAPPETLQGSIRV